MRTLIVAIACAFASTTLAAQTKPANPIDRGSILVGGSASVERQDTQGFSVTTASVFPDLLFFVAPRFALGGQLGLSYSSFEDGHSTSWTVGPAARFFLAHSESKLLPFVGASVARSSARFTSGGAADAKFSTWAVEGVAGMTQMLSRQIGLTGTAYVRHNTSSVVSTSPTTKSSYTLYGVRFGFSAFLF